MNLKQKQLLERDELIRTELGRNSTKVKIASLLGITVRALHNYICNHPEFRRNNKVHKRGNDAWKAYDNGPLWRTKQLT
jgi:hypothetical protein